MRMVMYGDCGEERLGVDVGDKIMDVHVASQGMLPDNMIELLEGDAIDRLQDLVIKYNENDAKRTALIEKDGLRIGAPVPCPRSIVCVGLNYKDHAAESGLEIPPEPLLFSKSSSCVVGPFDDIAHPLVTEQFDYEVELAVVIGKKAKDVSEAESYNYVAGYTAFNDVSARDLQFSEPQWFRAKSLDGSGPMGPFLVTKDEVSDPNNLNVSLSLNGEMRQQSNTVHLGFNVPQLVSFISHSMTLRPGDIISTGTPSGVGFASDPPRFLKPGDLMETTVEGVGVMRNRIIAANG